MRTTAPPSSHIEGTWRLDAPASDDASARIQQYIAVQEQKMRAQQRNARNRGPRDDEDIGEDDGGPEGADAPDDSGGSGPGGSGGGGSGGRGQGGRGGGGRGGGGNSSTTTGAAGRQSGPSALNALAIKELRSQLQLSETAARTLSIGRSGETVSIAVDGLPPRGYLPGESFSRIDEIGTASMASGWDGAAFVVRTRYSNRVERTERYELDPHTGQLIITRTINEPRTGKLALRSVYERG